MQPEIRPLNNITEENKNTVMICDELSRDYKKEFGINPTTIMTASDLIGSVAREPFPKKKTKISYIGNTGDSRHLVLSEIGQELKHLYNGNILIDTYSVEYRK